MWKDELVEILFSNDCSKINPKKAIDLKFTNTPPSLFKYRSFENKHSLKLLKEDKMLLSNPNSFNDPFDSALKLVVKDMPKKYKEDLLLNKIEYEYFKDFNISRKEFNKAKKKKDPIYELFRLYIEKNEPDIPFKERRKRIRVYLNKFNNNILDLEHKKNLHVVCFSETNKSILMWSHYATNHEGFCAEYDFRKLGINNPYVRFIFPVIYTKSVFDLSYYLETYDEGFVDVLKEYMVGINPNDIQEGIKMPERGKINNMSMLFNALQKFTDWSYEKEWRYVFPYQNITNKKIYFPVPKPKAIYLGAMVSEENCEKILKIGRERNMSIYKMNTNPTEFSLEPNLLYSSKKI